MGILWFSLLINPAQLNPVSACRDVSLWFAPSPKSSCQEATKSQQLTEAVQVTRVISMKFMIEETENGFKNLSCNYFFFHRDTYSLRYSCFLHSGVFIKTHSCPGWWRCTCKPCFSAVSFLYPACGREAPWLSSRGSALCPLQGNPSTWC